MYRECRERLPRHRGLAIPTCITGSLTSGFLLFQWRGKRSRHYQCMSNPRVYVSGEGHIVYLLIHALICYKTVCRSYAVLCMNKWLPFVNRSVVLSIKLKVGIVINHCKTSALVEIKSPRKDEFWCNPLSVFMNEYKKKTWAALTLDRRLLWQQLLLHLASGDNIQIYI